jgi:type III restriction enzyme
LNDEAHHLWDPDSAWNDAIEYVHQTIRDRSGGEIVSQLDFSATPKDNHGRTFQHVICDTPLGEAVDAGIVKIPVIGPGRRACGAPQRQRRRQVSAAPHDRIQTLATLKQEWEKSGKKALLFIMAEKTEAADQIARELNTSSLYSEA